MVHGVAKSRTRLSGFTFTFHFHALEKEIASHSSVLAWRIPGTGEPDELPSMGSHRVGHDGSDLAAAAAAASDALQLGTRRTSLKFSHHHLGRHVAANVDQVPGEWVGVFINHVI